MKPIVYGMLRVKNEGRWIGPVIDSIRKVCNGGIFLFDDHSTDETITMASRAGASNIYRSTFEGLDETRDKDFLLQRIIDAVIASEGRPNALDGDPQSRHWCLAIDGDEVLDASGGAAIVDAISRTESHAFALPIRYLWNSDITLVGVSGARQYRVDGVYGRFARPSLFRLMNSRFRFQSTQFGGNLHCSSIPQELLHWSKPTIDAAPLWHLGYNFAEDRIRKYHWYNEVDPNNTFEDLYRHIVVGDLFPADTRRTHGGPLHLTKC